MEVIGKTDSKTLKRAIRAAMGVRSRKLCIDIARIKEMVEMGEVTEIRWVSGMVEAGVVERIYGRLGRRKKRG